MKEAEEQIAIDLGNEYEEALSDATQEEIIDLAGLIWNNLIFDIFIDMENIFI